MCFLNALNFEFIMIKKKSPYLPENITILSIVTNTNAINKETSFVQCIMLGCGYM